MAEVVWYSRLAVVAACLVLLVQAIAGQTTNALTIVATVALVSGFVVFLSGLALEGR